MTLILGDVTDSLPAKLPPAFASAQSSAASDPSHPKCSERISIVRDGELAVEGDLTIHGVTRKVVFTVEDRQPPTKDPWGNTRVAVSGTTIVPEGYLASAISRSCVDVECDNELMGPVLVGQLLARWLNRRFEITIVLQAQESYAFRDVTQPLGAIVHS